MLMTWIAKTLHGSPELAMFLAVAVGYWLGNIKLGKFSLGTVTAALLAGLVIGQVGVEMDRQLRWGLFYLFLFANGYSAGPQFFRALKQDGIKSMLLSLTVTVAGLATAYTMARLLALDPGMSAGLVSGSLTQSSAIGTATDAIMNLVLPLEERKRLVNHIAVADALTYVFGAIGMIWFVSSAAPRLLGIDLRREAVALDAQYGIKSETLGVYSAYRKYGVRTYHLSDSVFVGKSIEEAEQNTEGIRYFVERVHRGARILDALPGTVLESGDVVVVSGRIDSLLVVGPRFGTEVHDPELLDFPVEALNVVVTNKKALGPPLGQLAASQEFDSRGVGLRTVTRAGQEIPISPMTVFHRGDVIELVGPQRAVERVAREVGYALRPSNATSLSTIGIGILIGALIGLPFVMLGNVKLTLSISVGALVAGLVFGWARSVRPTFGSIPQPALQFMIDFGLAAFVAGAGLQAGPEFVRAVKELGAALLLAGVAVTLVPQLAALFVGRYLLKMNPLLLLGGLAGAQTFTGALAAVQEKAGSRTPVLAYTVPYATSNILLTLCGALIVALVA
jgi:putative transport protein